MLTNGNGRLKSQVDNSRNSRVIYSNVYKTLEREIRKHEYLYRLAIIDSLAYQEVATKLREKTEKLTRKLEREIGELEGGAGIMRKKVRRSTSSRVNTGVTSSTRVQIIAVRWRAWRARTTWSSDQSPRQKQGLQNRYHWYGKEANCPRNCSRQPL